MAAQGYGGGGSMLEMTQQMRYAWLRALAPLKHTRRGKTRRCNFSFMVGDIDVEALPFSKTSNMAELSLTSCRDIPSPG